MAWKIEQWLSDVFPGESEIYAEYRSLPPRELAVVAGAVLDLALAQLLAHRLMDNKKETESLLGLDGDGRAPVASFGSRIQLALLVGLITPADAEILRSIKSLRNLFAHRVNVSFISPEVVAVTTKLHELWVRRTAQLIAAGTLPGNAEHLKAIGPLLPQIPEAGEGLLLAIFATYQAYCHRLLPRVVRVGDVLLDSSKPSGRQESVH